MGFRRHISFFDMCVCVFLFSLPYAWRFFFVHCSLYLLVISTVRLSLQHMIFIVFQSMVLNNHLVFYFNFLFHFSSVGYVVMWFLCIYLLSMYYNVDLHHFMPELRLEPKRMQNPACFMVVIGFCRRFPYHKPLQLPNTCNRSWWLSTNEHRYSIPNRWTKLFG